MPQNVDLRGIDTHITEPNPAHIPEERPISAAETAVIADLDSREDIDETTCVADLAKIKRTLLIVIAALIVVSFATGILASAYFMTNDSLKTNVSAINEAHEAVLEEQDAVKDEVKTIANAHEHVWQPNTELIHHDAKTEVIEHPAVYQSVTNYHTICNDCSEIIDGKTAEHKEATGHLFTTTNVPVKEEVLVSAAYSETVVREAAYDELVTASETCALCGETRDVESSANAES